MGEPAQAHIDMNARRVQDPSPLPPCAVWFDKEDLASELPRRWQILLRLLALPLEVFEVSGRLIWEVTADPRIANEGIDVLSHNRGHHYSNLLLHLRSDALLTNTRVEVQ